MLKTSKRYKRGWFKN